MAADVNTLTQVFARFEMWNVLAGQRYSLARLRIAPNAWGTVVKRKTSKAPNLNTLSLGQRITHKIKEMLNCQLHIFRRQVFLLAGDCFNKF